MLTSKNITMKKIIGISILVLIFGVLFVSIAMDAGLSFALLIYGITIIVTFLIVLAVRLITNK